MGSDKPTRSLEEDGISARQWRLVGCHCFSCDDFYNATRTVYAWNDSSPRKNDDSGFGDWFHAQHLRRYLSRRKPAEIFVLIFPFDYRSRINSSSLEQKAKVEPLLKAREGGIIRSAV